ncbi:YdeI/OmpD-associated family protein [Streptomyces sp. NBC_00289]|uniref:YdeI/OmpD-associated family protein n=1 Tax=Streptomyces sp. NBC_00289 TaxID=2975703 RepID=UPI00352D214E
MHRRRSRPPPEAFRALSPTRQKAHVTSIDGAKTDVTRQRGITKVVEELTHR